MRSPPSDLSTDLPEVSKAVSRAQPESSCHLHRSGGLAQPRRTVLFAVLPEAVEGAAVRPGEDADSVLLTIGPLPIIALSCGPLEGALRTVDSRSGS